jgi:hypothetical protein
MEYVCALGYNLLTVWRYCEQLQYSAAAFISTYVL